MNRMVHKLGHEASAGLLAFNCLSGCNSTSYFSRKRWGKDKALKYHLREHNKYLLMKQLEVMLSLSEEVKASAVAFKCVTVLYCKTMQINDGDLNSLRYKFCVQHGK